MITTGGTSEYIDAIRKITNSSSGKLGSMIANECIYKTNINKIFYVCTPKSIKPNIDLIKKYNIDIEIFEVVTTREVKKIIEFILNNEKIDFFIHSMAISDYYIDYVTTSSFLSKDLLNSNNFEETLKNANIKLDNTNKLS